LYIGQIPQVLAQKDRKSASLFGSHVNPLLSKCESSKEGVDPQLD